LVFFCFFASMFENGYIFVCTNETEQECFSLNLFGAPKNMSADISKITRETGIFLLKKTEKFPIMYGVFLADSPPGENLSPLAFGGKFPAQIRIRQYYKFSPLPKAAFKNLVWRDLNCGKMKLWMTGEQTLDLITSFIILTRLDLNHRIKCSLSGEMGKYLKRHFTEQ